MRILKLMAVALTVAMIAGCAGPNQRVDQDNLFCAIAGGLVGGATGAVLADGNGAGAVVGAMLAVLLCQDGDDAVVAEPMAVAISECPTDVPPGALTDAQGCAFDSDGDGVVDGLDLCANTPSGVSVDRVGCPLDADRDAVPDYLDLCPSTPLGTIVDPDGCPLPGQNLLSLTGVNFDTNKSVLTSSAKDILEQAVELLKTTDSVIEVRVEGHTDSRGSDNHNLTLSQSRAEAVVDYLVGRGVNGDRLLAVGMGEGFPVADNDTAAGQAANRRVDFVVSQ